MKTHSLNNSRLLPVALVLTTICFVAGCRSDDEPVTSNASSEDLRPKDAHERMIWELSRIRFEARKSNEYFQTQQVEELRKLLSDPQTNRTDLARFETLWLLAPHELRLGKTEEAVQYLEEALKLLPFIEEKMSREQIELFYIDLAVAWLRLGETQNCVHCETGESCIFPIRNAGIHQKKDGSEKAKKYLITLLKRQPSSLTAKWLLNVAAMTLGEYPDGVPPAFLIPPEAFASDVDFPAFTNSAKRLGVDTMSCSGGSLVEDLDGDGDLDWMVSDWAPEGQLRLFRNDGQGGFEDTTEESGLTGLFGGLNLVQADYDDDGDIDVLVLRGAWLESNGNYPNSLLQNDGKGNFRDVSFDVGFGEKHYATQTGAWADFDNDGDLDLYIGNEVGASQLFENQGDGTFQDIAATAGVENNRKAKGVVWGDFDNDRYPDLYVSNLGKENRLYRNMQDGTFEDVAAEMGVAGPIHSFPVWFWDYNQDGRLDLFVSSYLVGVKHIAADYMGMDTESEPDAVYRNDGTQFTNVSQEVGLSSETQPMGANFGDVDNDGYPDFYLGTGYPGFRGLMPNRLFHNEQGSRFSDVTTAARVGHLQKGHGVAFGDFDEDGDQDLFLEMGGAYPADAFRNVLFENPGFDRHSITVQVIGQESNRSGIGVQIRATFRESVDSEPRTVYTWVGSGGSFGANSLRQHIGVGQAAKVDQLEVYWPTTGNTQTFENLPVNNVFTVSENTNTLRKRVYRLRSSSVPNGSVESSKD